MKKIRLLHIVNYDKKFFEDVMRCFEEDERFDNSPIIVAKNEENRNEIGEVGHNVTIMLDNKSLRYRLQSEDYDAVFFHSLPYRFWPIVTYIPHDKKIIWWAWGLDLYFTLGFCRPFIKINLYKEETQKLYEGRNSAIIRCLAWLRDAYESLHYVRLRKNVLARIDYFQPVISLEYEMMKKQNPDFRAKEFYYPYNFRSGELLTVQKADGGNILLGNSANFTNNHLDVWRQIRNKVDEHQSIIIPVNYGIRRYSNIISEKLNSKNVVLIKEMLAKNEYFKVLENCSYMVIGVLRQQAMGNISWAIRNGIKVFLFIDSIVYQYLRKMGIVVYSLEDVNDESFTKALSLEDANNNISLYAKESERRKKVLEMFFEDL